MYGRDQRPAMTGMGMCLPRVRTWASVYQITLGEPRHVDVIGDSAYVVVPATMTFNIQAKQVTQTGSIFTVALRKLGTEWRLTAWAGAKGT